MKEKLRIVVMCLNAFLILIGLWFGVPVIVIGDTPQDKRTHEEVRAFTESVSSAEKLRQIVVADDASIRAEKEKVSLLREATITGSAVAVLAGVGTITLPYLYAKRL